MKEQIQAQRLERKIASLEAENRALRKQAATMADAAERAAAAKPAFKLTKEKRRKVVDDWVRVIIPDTHGCKVDARALSAVLAEVKQLDPHEVVLLGDHVDCGGFLAQHHVMGYVAETGYTYEEDIASARYMLDEIQKAAPRAVIHYIEGNHERRVETWAVTQTLRNPQDADMLRKQFAPEYLLDLAGRGIRYIRQAECYDGLDHPGTIKLGKVFFWHGTSTADNAGKTNALQVGGNIVYGHTHRAQSWPSTNLHVGDHGAWCPGCLCERKPLWNHTRPNKWTHGFGVQIVSVSGEFLHINVPIVGGRSLLMNLLKKKA